MPLYTFVSTINTTHSVGIKIHIIYELHRSPFDGHVLVLDYGFSSDVLVGLMMGVCVLCECMDLSICI